VALGHDNVGAALGDAASSLDVPDEADDLCAIGVKLRHKGLRVAQAGRKHGHSLVQNGVDLAASEVRAPHPATPCWLLLQLRQVELVEYVLDPLEVRVREAWPARAWRVIRAGALEGRRRPGDVGRQQNVDPERLVREVADLLYLAADLVAVHRRRANDTQPAGSRNGRDKLGRCDASHPGQDYGMLDAQ
jgi:hypothetical protein